MKHALIAIALLTVAIVFGSMAYFATASRQTGHLEPLKIRAAAATYAADLKARGLPVPATVSLRELVDRHLLSESDTSVFSGMEVTVNLFPDESRPQDALVRAHLDNGHDLVLLADGSVQEMLPGRLAQ